MDSTDQHIDPARATDSDTVSMEEISSGEYFQEARRWYDVLYIRPIHERIFFILCAFIALMTGFFGLIALDGITPLKNEEPFVYLNREYNTIPFTQKIRGTSEDMNTVLKRFMVTQFVKYHESYAEEKYVSNQRYIRNYGSKDVYRSYKRAIDPKNPRSPLVLYQKNFQRKVYIDGLQLIGESPPYQAIVDYTSIVMGQDQRVSRTYTATMRYEYTPWDESAKEIVDPETGDIQLNLEEIEFKVIDYDVRARVE